MPKLIIKYKFKDHVDMDAVESDLTLAILAAEGLFGRPRVLLECGLAMDKENRGLVIESGSQVGHTVNIIFVGLVHRFIGEGSFHVKRIYPDQARNRRKRKAETKVAS